MSIGGNKFAVKNMNCYAMCVQLKEHEESPPLAITPPHTNPSSCHWLRRRPSSHYRRVMAG